MSPNSTNQNGQNSQNGPNGAGAGQGGQGAGQGGKRHDKRRRQQQQQHKKPNSIDVWKQGGELPPTRRIAQPTDVGALLRSLGDPPVGNGTAAGHYFNAVIERAAAVALALAVSADLLDDDA